MTTKNQMLLATICVGCLAQSREKELHLHGSHERHVKPEGKPMDQAWVEHVELEGDLDPNKGESRDYIQTICFWDAVGQT